MYCPDCGAEVVEQAGFCHKCGQRLETLDQQFPPDEQTDMIPTPEGGPAEDQPPQAPPEPPPTPAERFKESAAARQEGADEPEEQLWQGRYAAKAMIGAWALSGLITLVLLVIWCWWRPSGGWWLVLVVVILLLWIYQLGVMKYRQWNVRYELTTQRFIHHTGILRRVTDRIELIDMDDITFEQKLLERFVGVGTIRVTSSDRTHPELVLVGIEDVKQIAGRIDDTRRSERRRRGLHIESI